MSAIADDGRFVFDDIDECGRVRINDFLEDGTMITTIVHVPVTYKYHLLMTRFWMRPRAWSILKRVGIRIGIRRPHKPFRVERPIQPTVT